MLLAGGYGLQPQTLSLWLPNAVSGNLCVWVPSLLIFLRLGSETARQRLLVALKSPEILMKGSQCMLQWRAVTAPRTAFGKQVVGEKTRQSAFGPRCRQLLLAELS